MKQFLRRIELTIGDKSIKNYGDNALNCGFEVSFSAKTSEPDLSKVTIYNLSEDTINNIKKNDIVLINAGYEGDIGNILNGTVQKTETEWQNVDKITTIFVTDGGKNWKNSTTNKTYQNGTKASYIIRDLANIMGYEVGEIAPVQDIIYQLGKSVSGPTRNSLQTIVKDTKSKLFIDGNKLYVRAINKSTPNGYLVNSDTGMIGSPEKVEEEKDEKVTIKYKVKCLLNYHIRKDNLIRVESRTINGNFRVESGTHTGSDEGDFITEMVLLPA